MTNKQNSSVSKVSNGSGSKVSQLAKIQKKAPNVKRMITKDQSSSRKDEGDMMSLGNNQAMADEPRQSMDLNTSRDYSEQSPLTSQKIQKHVKLIKAGNSSVASS